jgi:hypothetical protein
MLIASTASLSDRSGLNINVSLVWRLPQASRFISLQCCLLLPAVLAVLDLVQNIICGVAVGMQACMRACTALTCCRTLCSQLDGLAVLPVPAGCVCGA